VQNGQYGFTPGEPQCATLPLTDEPDYSGLPANAGQILSEFQSMDDEKGRGEFYKNCRNSRNRTLPATQDIALIENVEVPGYTYYKAPGTYQSISRVAHKDTISVQLPLGKYLASRHLYDKCYRGSENIPETTTPINDARLASVLKYAYTQMYPTPRDISGNAEGATFILEMRDFARSYRALKQVASNLTHLRQQGVKSIADLARHFVGKKTRAKLEGTAVLAADLRLTWAYAIRPLISELNQVVSAASKVDAYMQRWNEDADAAKWRTRRFNLRPYLTQGLTNTLEYPEETIYAEHIDTMSVGLLRPGWFDVQDCVWAFGYFQDLQPPLTTIDVPITLSYSDSVKDELVSAWSTLGYRPKRVNMKYWSDTYKAQAFGAFTAVSTAWELTRFSFLVDYIVSVGKYLEQFDPILDLLPTHDVRYGYSIKTKRTRCLRVTASLTSLSEDLENPLRPSWAPVHFPGTQYSRSSSMREVDELYERRRLDPADYNARFAVSTAPLQLRKANLDKAINVVSLITSIWLGKK
jgi:hypothetical protein